MPHERPFYHELKCWKISKAFKRYARSYRIEILNSKGLSGQLTASTKDFPDEIKGFEYQVTVKILLSKHKENGDREFAPVYFNSTTKTVINSIYDLDKSF